MDKKYQDIIFRVQKNYFKDEFDTYFIRMVEVLSIDFTECFIKIKYRDNEGNLGSAMFPKYRCSQLVLD